MRMLVAVAFAALLSVVSGSAFAQTDDFRGDTLTTCAISPGGAVNGSIEVAGDSDWCRVQLAAGLNAAFQVQVSGQPGQALTLPNGAVRLFDPSGNQLAPSGFAADTVSYTSTTAMTAYVDVRSVNIQTGTYRLVMAAADDIRGDVNSAATILPGQVANGVIEGGLDSDWFRTTFVEGKRYEAKVLKSGDLAGLTLQTATLELRGADGTVLASASNTGAPSLSFVVNSGGDAFLSVGQRTSLGSYRLQLSDDDVGETPATAVALPPGVARQGSIEVASDIDAYAIPLEIGRHHTAIILGNGTDDLTNGNVCITAQRPSGSQFTFQCSGGSSSASFTLTTDEAGKWLFKASSALFQLGTYRIGITGRDDYTVDANTTGRVYPGFFTWGTIEAAGDEDRFKTALAAGQPATVQVRHAQSGVGTLTQSNLFVLDPSGTEVAQDVGGGDEPAVTFTPAASGDYTIREVGYCFAFGSDCRTGTYRIGVTQGATPPVATTIAAATLPNVRSVQLGDTATFFGTIINSGAQTATNCGVVPTAAVAGEFTFARTNVANQVIGQTNQRFDIAPGAAAGMVLSFAPSTGNAGQAVSFDFRCSNTDAAGAIDGVNSFTLVADPNPVPDLIMIAATQSNDGIANIPGPSGTGFFSTAAVNIGAAGLIEFKPVATPQSGLAPLVCETSPTTGACLAPLSASVTRSMATGDTAFFSVFFGGGGQTVPFDPANRRIQLLARDAAGALTSRGSTSVAVRTN